MGRDDNNMYAWIGFWAAIGLVLLIVYYATISQRIKRYWLFLLFCTSILSLLNLILIIRAWQGITMSSIIYLLLILSINIYYVAKTLLSKLKRYDTFIVPASLLIITMMVSLLN